MKIAIIANGEPLDRIRLNNILADVDIIIAADGGADICKKNLIIPDYIIGDLDSIEEISYFEKSKIIKRPSQDNSDMEKALEFAKRFDADVIKIISALGKRSDHAIINVIVFTQFEFNQKLEIYDNYGKMRILSPGRHCFKFEPETIVSLFSLGNISALSLRGFKYNLIEQDFNNGFCGLSNETIAEEVEIEFIKGQLFISVLE